jgi:hypothetical protein
VSLPWTPYASMTGLRSKGERVVARASGGYGNAEVSHSMLAGSSSPPSFTGLTWSIA